MKNDREEQVPMDLQLDLLVDAELPEKDRRALLLSMDREPGGAGEGEGRWRALAIRFLERQTERQSIQEFVMARGAEMAVKEKAERYRFANGRMPRAVAAGLLLVAISGVVTMIVLRRPVDVAEPGPVAVTARNLDRPFFPVQSAMEAGRPSNRSVVIQPDGNGNAVVIPVNTLPMKFY